VKSSPQQRPVSTLGFSESNSSAAEVPVEKMSASRSIVALVNDGEANDGANNTSDIYAKVLKQVYDAFISCTLLFFVLFTPVLDLAGSLLPFSTH